MMPEDLTAEDCRGRFILIVGEVNSGKTTYTARLLQAYLLRFPEPVAVVDLAPRLPQRSAHPAFRPGIGGRLTIPESPRVHCFSTDVAAPRLQAESMEERLLLAEENARRIASLLVHVDASKFPAVFVNDVSLYLQAGSVKNLLEWLDGFSTRVVNGYYGVSLGTDAFSARERSGMEQLMRRCDRLVRF
uniref:Uncharacterized protein n=1 Tax=Desulfacinum infernum TaxID=35837 RepID=A0A832A099_9BACT